MKIIPFREGVERVRIGPERWIWVLTYKGIRKPAAAWCRTLGITPATMQYRCSAGWTACEAILGSRELYQ